jgi:hypothetical protein
MKEVSFGPWNLWNWQKVRLTIETGEEALARAQAILDPARQCYEGLSEEQVAEMEAARLDTTHFFASREPVS